MAQAEDAVANAPAVENSLSAPAEDRIIKFELDIQPILTSTSCNSGGCHGKSRGQNGFALSLLGFDSDFDYSAIVQEGRGRRVFPASPDQSLLLLKATALLPHGGGVRIEPDSEEYQLIHQWISQGMHRTTADDPVLQHVVIHPDQRTMIAGDQEQLSVTAHYSDGSTRDVTKFTSFQSSETAVVAVTEAGLVTAGALPGEATIMARYLDQISTWSTAIPMTGDVAAAYYAALPRNNFIDELSWEKLQSLNITVSAPAEDHVFLRRAYLDAIGRIPTIQESRDFLSDTSPDKRVKLIDALLERDEFADYWANKWVDLLRPNPYRVGIKATLNFDNWIREAFRQNVPYDQFVHGLITASGSTWHNGATTLYRDRRSPDEIATMVSQLFLGIRIDCAKCHQHPFESLGQEDFYSFAAYFAKLGRKGTGLSPPISGGEEIVHGFGSGTVTHPLTDKVLQPKPLFAAATEIPADQDPRVALADWMTSPDNTYFAQVASNRIWADIMGRGLVDPVDDLRATNPPTNAALLNALAEHFRDEKFDTKQLIRTIMTSHLYSLSSLPNEQNVADSRNHSRYLRQQLRGEVLLDAISDVTSVPETFGAMPAGSRAVELWTFRIQSHFLDTFGRPDANQDPPCERIRDTTVVQALHLMNSPDMHRKVTSDHGKAAQLAKSDLAPTALAEELYLLVYNRFPTEEERQLAAELIQPAPGDRRQVVEDLMWALINTPEFIFKN